MSDSLHIFTLLLTDFLEKCQTKSFENEYSTFCHFRILYHQSTLQKCKLGLWYECVWPLILCLYFKGKYGKQSQRVHRNWLGNAVIAASALRLKEVKSTFLQNNNLKNDTYNISCWRSARKHTRLSPPLTTLLIVLAA